MTAPQTAAPRSGLAVAGFVCGLLGVLLGWVPFFGWPLPILGIVFGALGWQHGLGKAGVILGIVGLTIGVIVLVALAAGG